MNDQQKSNVAAILAKAKVLINRNKSEAVKAGDIALSIGIANQEAQMEAYFRQQGIESQETP